MIDSYVRKFYFIRRPTGMLVHCVTLVSFQLFCKNFGNLRKNIFFGGGGRHLL